MLYTSNTSNVWIIGLFWKNQSVAKGAPAVKGVLCPQKFEILCCTWTLPISYGPFCTNPPHLLPVLILYTKNRNWDWCDRSAISGQEGMLWYSISQTLCCSSALIREPGWGWKHKRTCNWQQSRRQWSPCALLPANRHIFVQYLPHVKCCVFLIKPFFQYLHQTHTLTILNCSYSSEGTLAKVARMPLVNFHTYGVNTHLNLMSNAQVTETCPCTYERQEEVLDILFYN